MLVEVVLVSILNSVNLAFLIEQTRAAKLYNRGGVELRETTTPRYFTRGVAGDSRLTLDYCAELVTNAFRLTPSARRKDTADSLLAGGSTACLLHYNGPSKHFWRTRLT